MRTARQVKPEAKNYLRMFNTAGYGLYPRGSGIFVFRIWEIVASLKKMRKSLVCIFSGYPFRSISFGIPVSEYFPLYKNDQTQSVTQCNKLAQRLKNKLLASSANPRSILVREHAETISIGRKTSSTVIYPAAITPVGLEKRKVLQ